MSHTRSILLVRHGESLANAGEASPSPETVVLTPAGERQARAVAEALEDAPELIVVSRFQRARQTAEPTHARFPKAKLEQWPVEEFHYLGAEAYRGTTKRDRRDDRDEYWRTCNPQLACAPGAETFSAFHARVHAVRARLERSDARQIVVFSHKKLLHGLLWSWSEGAPPADAAAMARFRAFDLEHPFPNGAWIEVELEGTRARAGKLHRKHLDRIEA
jgi:broad specificity phosphatase PhoE